MGNRHGIRRKPLKGHKSQPRAGMRRSRAFYRADTAAELERSVRMEKDALRDDEYLHSFARGMRGLKVLFDLETQGDITCLTT